MLLLQGGPGGSAAPLLAGLAGSKLRDHREIVVLEQRGAPGARPALTCPVPQGLAVFITAGRTCGLRLAKRVGGSLNALDAAHAAADVASLAHALGEPKLDVYGMSWGSRVALDVLRDHPEVVGRAVLDGVVPAQADMLADAAPSMGAALDQLVAACSSGPACRRAHPDLRREMAAAARVRGGGSAVYAALNNPVTLPLAPTVIAALAHRDFRKVKTILRRLGSGAEIATGANYAAICRDDGLRTSVAKLKATARRAQPLASDAALSAYDVFTDCAGWPVDPAPRSELEPVRTDAPVLLLSGRFDPTTPPSYAKAAARTMTHAQQVVFNFGTHVAYGSRCAAIVVDAFLSDGRAAHPPCVHATP